jgi:hypothetical protein
MSQSDGKNPEHRSNNAMLCFCLGVGLVGFAYFLGIGAVLGAALSGGDPAVVAGSAIGAIGLALMGVSGFVLMLVGGAWMIARVIADQRSDESEKRYRDVER